MPVTPTARAFLSLGYPKSGGVCTSGTFEERAWQQPCVLLGEMAFFWPQFPHFCKMVSLEQYSPDVAVTIGVGLLTHLFRNHWLWHCCDIWWLRLVCFAVLHLHRPKVVPRSLLLTAETGVTGSWVPAGGTRVLSYDTAFTLWGVRLGGRCIYMDRLGGAQAGVA